MLKHCIKQQTEWEPGGKACVTPHGANMSKKQNGGSSTIKAVPAQEVRSSVIKNFIIDMLWKQRPYALTQQSSVRFPQNKNLLEFF